MSIHLDQFEIFSNVVINSILLLNLIYSTEFSKTRLCGDQLVNCKLFQLELKLKADGLSHLRYELRILTARGQRGQQQPSKLD